jgi:hypothetical protein
MTIVFHFQFHYFPPTTIQISSVYLKLTRFVQNSTRIPEKFIESGMSYGFCHSLQTKKLLYSISFVLDPFRRCFAHCIERCLISPYREKVLQLNRELINTTQLMQSFVDYNEQSLQAVLQLCDDESATTDSSFIRSVFVNMRRHHVTSLTHRCLQQTYLCCAELWIDSVMRRFQCHLDLDMLCSSSSTEAPVVVRPLPPFCSERTAHIFNTIIDDLMTYNVHMRDTMRRDNSLESISAEPTPLLTLNELQQMHRRANDALQRHGDEVALQIASLESVAEHFAQLLSSRLWQTLQRTAHLSKFLHSLRMLYLLGDGALWTEFV